jgi:hypothetical protein
MYGPGTRGAGGSGIGAQNTHGESNPAHFSVNAARSKVKISGHFAQPGAASGAALSTFGTGSAKTDAENPQLN